MQTLYITILPSERGRMLTLCIPFWTRHGRGMRAGCIYRRTPPRTLDIEQTPFLGVGMICSLTPAKRAVPQTMTVVDLSQAPGSGRSLTKLRSNRYSTVDEAC